MTAFGTPYGACDSPYAPGWTPSQKSVATRLRQTNLLAVVICLALPVLIFAGVLALESFGLHYTQPGTTRLLEVLVGLFVAGLGAFACCLCLLPGRLSLDPKWYMFLFVTSALALVLGITFGNQNFNANMVPYSDLSNLNAYNDLDPSTTQGNMVMDAGEIHFKQGSYVENRMSMGFKDKNTYCVAPIACCDDHAVEKANFRKLVGDNSSAAGSTASNGTAIAGQQEKYDFWAVGMNCCSGQFPDFHCGGFNNPKVRSGLRLMNEELRPYFRLALLQAEAAFKVQAKNPVFVFWLEDPSHETNNYLEAAHKFFATGVSLFIVGQLLAVILVTVTFSKFFP